MDGNSDDVGGSVSRMPPWQSLILPVILVNCTTDNSLDASNPWKRSEKAPYLAAWLPLLRRGEK